MYTYLQYTWYIYVFVAVVELYYGDSVCKVWTKGVYRSVGPEMKEANCC